MDKVPTKGRSPHKRFSTLTTDAKGPRRSVKELEFLPDGSHISPHKIVLKKSEDDNTAVRETEYIGSFPVIGEDQNARAEHVRKKLTDFRENINKSKPVLLVISLSGIKVCSHTGESVYMAHALKRISYATCDPEYNQFSFMAREPKGHSTSQFCHAFITKTAEEAEELNTIVGNAFKMAYTIQWEQEQRYVNLDQQQAEYSDTSLQSLDELTGESSVEQSPSILPSQDQPTFHQLIEQQVQEQKVKNEEYQQQKKEILQQRLNRISTPNIEEQLKERRERRQREKEELEREIELQRLEGKSRMTWAKHVAQKAKHRMPVIDNIDGATVSRLNGSPNNDLNTVAAANSPRFHSINELREAMETGSLRTYGSPVMTLKETIDNHCDFSGRGKQRGALVQGETQAEVYGGGGDDQSSYMIDRPLPETPGRSNPNRRSKGKGQHKSSPKMNQSRDSTHYNNSTRSRSHSGSRSSKNGHDGSSKRLSGRYQNDSPVHSRSNSSGSEIPEEGELYQGPTSTLRYDSIRRLDPRDLPVEEELKNAAWYQHGIPREIALEILNQQEIGSFIVRDSTTHPGCFALSVKVPKFDNPVGISHYLIVRDPKRGVRLKGLDKVWPNLTALVTHHTVMPEMLPCTLRLPRNSSNPLYRERDDEREENYQKITDFSGMVQEMKI